ncbi:hypothetical protein [Rhodococcus sp. ARC_M6]|uniref:hypothetical protein n=1 Tax=Rhodococcus sp. ARC_M6 TaxID=2928852 RepID=UPI001FB361FB|nr:hypothetical protein [Rhodococcus sp. ARC_M6]MCJ0905167.1 hypothetical protein [Rhodococcus sp. ARC_M6]
MSTRTMPVVRVPATDTAAALLLDWLIRDVLPAALDGGAANHASVRLRTLPPISHRHIRSPRKLRVHARRVGDTIAAIEDQIRIRAVSVDAERALARPTIVLPDPVLNAAASIGGAMMDIGSSSAALAYRALLLVPATIESEEAAFSTQVRVIDSYCALLTRLWHSDFQASIVIPPPIEP